MSSITIANGLTLEYEVMGNQKNPPVLLIMGLGAQLTLWPEEFCQRLVDFGYYVIRFDNRDIGLSSKMKGHAPNPLKLVAQVRLGLPYQVPYTLYDMTDDTLFLMDALNLEPVHVVGVSMGGMIAQILGAKHPHRVKSLTMIMTSSGHPDLPLPSWRVMNRMIARPRSKKKEVIVAHSVKTWRMIGSPGYPADIQELQDRVEKNYERSYYPAGYKRQLTAILVAADRWKLLSKIKVPSLIIHGTHDPMNPIVHGRDLAQRIRKSFLLEIDGMGHNLPSQLVPRLSSYIHQHIHHSMQED